MNENGSTTIQNLRDQAKAALRGSLLQYKTISGNKRNHKQPNFTPKRKEEKLEGKK